MRASLPLALPSADVRTWHSNVEQHASEGVNKILIGNKCDWEESKKVVSGAQARELAEELGVPYLETSAKSSINVDEAFFALARDIKKRLIDTAAPSSSGGAAASGAAGAGQSSGAVNVGAGGGQQEKGGCC